MRSFVALLILPVLAAAHVDIKSSYGYITKYAIPYAEELKKAEDAAIVSGRIVGGEESALGDQPYQAGLLSELLDGRRGVCGGSLVSETKVLTAAHCWNDGQNQVWRFEVVLGSVLLFHGGVRIYSSDVVTHNWWIPILIRNDIAMITLPERVQFSDIISPVSLPTLLESFDTFASELAVASGFGQTETGADIPDSQSLQSVSLRIITNDICRQLYPLYITDSNICTSGLGGTGTCRGDSGGPLVVQRGNRRILVGVTSFGFAVRCEIGFPAAYARVTSFLSFINQNL